MSISESQILRPIKKIKKDKYLSSPPRMVQLYYGKHVTLKGKTYAYYLSSI